MKFRFVIAFAAVFSAIGVGGLSNFRKAESAGRANFGAKCAIQSFQTAFEQSKAVFVGEVVGEEKAGDTRVFDFKVEKFWKGANAKRLEIYVYETARFQAWFKKGDRYLVYAGADDNGQLSVSKCSRSRDIELAEEDLQKLGKGKTPR